MAKIVRRTLWKSRGRGDGTFYIEKITRAGKQKLVELGPERFFYEAGDDPVERLPLDYQQKQIAALADLYAQLTGSTTGRNQ